MRDLDEIFGITKIELSEKDIASVPMTVKETPTVTRVNPEELENCYLFDPVAFNGVNRAVQLILAAGYEIKCESEEVRGFILNFLDKIGEVGEDITFEEILYSIFQNQFIYGNAYIETVLNRIKNHIVDLTIVDSKRMDLAKDSSGKIVLNKFGKPIGFVQTLPWNVSAENLGDPKPDSVSLGGNKIFLLPERIAQFKLYPFGDRFSGIGIIEPAYKTILRKQNIEEAQANSIYARGTYPIIDYVGDENHRPTPAQLIEAAKNLAKLRHDRYFAVSKWHDIRPLEVKQSDIVEHTAEYLTTQECTAFGMAIALATGAGEKTNRSTLATQLKFLEFTLNSVARRTAATFSKYIFGRIAKFEKFKEVPQLVWKDIGVEFLKSAEKRLSQVE